MADIRVGLIGIGGMGGCHYGNYSQVKGAKLVAVADVRVDMAKEKTKGTDVKVYADYKEMLANEELDMVDICTPSFLHADMAIDCLKKGYHVLCEKPMTLTAEDAQRVLVATKATDKKFMAAHVVRFMAPYMYLRSVIESGELGKLLRLDMKRISSIPTWSWEDWMRDEKRSGGVITDLSIHDIDYVQSILGMPDSISSVHYGLKNNNDFAQTEMVYGDTLVSCEGTWYNAPIPFHATFLAVFENGYVENTDKLYKNGKPVTVEESAKAEELDLGINVGNDNGYLNEIQYFVDCVNNGTSPDFVTPESSAQTMALVDAIKSKAQKI
jgi:predicted dehydrogenase